MSENIKSVITFFADDMKLVGDSNDSDVVIQDLESLSNWESDWCMNFNFILGKITVDRVIFLVAMNSR